MLKHLDKVKDFFTFTEKQTFDLNKKILIKQLSHGITIIEDRSQNTAGSQKSCIINYFNRKIDVTDPSPRREQASVLNSKTRRQYFRSNLALWRAVFDCNNDIHYSNGVFSIKLNISRSVETFSNLSNREEVYFPLAFLRHDQPVGGAFINLWKCESAEIKPTFSYLPIKYFHTAACMFGGTLYGLDQEGRKHPLTEPDYIFPDETVITGIENQFSEHPDELLFRKSLANFVPLMKALAGGDSPIIMHQIPLANYIIYGLDKFLKNKMTKNAFALYLKEVILRAKNHKSFFQRFSRIHCIEIRFTGTLNQLNLDSFSEETYIEDLFKQLSFNSAILREKNGMSKLVENIINYLCSANNNVGEIWCMIRNELKADPTLINTQDLVSVNYLDYSATLALIRLEASNQHVCSLTPAHEKSMALGYKKLFAKKMGGILCISYLPSVHLSIDEYRNAIFYLKENINEINTLLNTELMDLSALQSAAVALDSIKLAKFATERIKLLLLLHVGRKMADEEIKLQECIF